MKRIVFLYIPHFYCESEVFRGNTRTPLIITAGKGFDSLIYDFPDELCRFGIKKGSRLKDIRFIKNIIIEVIDRGFTNAMNGHIIRFIKKLTDKYEFKSDGQFYIDLTGTERINGSINNSTQYIINSLKSRFGYNASAGIGSNKLIAYLSALSCNTGKVNEILPGHELFFLDRVSINSLPDLPDKIKNEIIDSYNIQLLNKIRKFSKPDLQAMFGEYGIILYNYSRNISDDILRIEKEKLIIADEIVLSSLSNDDNIIRSRFFNLVTDLAVQLRMRNIFPLRYKLKIQYLDDYIFRRKGRIKKPCFREKELYNELRICINNALERRIIIKKIYLGLYDFIPAFSQRNLFYNDDREINLYHAFDSIRRRYGHDAIKYAG